MDRLKKLLVAVFILTLFAGTFCVLIFQESEIADLQDRQIDVEKLVEIQNN